MHDVTKRRHVIIGGKCTTRTKRNILDSCDVSGVTCGLLFRLSYWDVILTLRFVCVCVVWDSGLAQKDGKGKKKKKKKRRGKGKQNKRERKMRNTNHARRQTERGEEKKKKQETCMHADFLDYCTVHTSGSTELISSHHNSYLFLLQVTLSSLALSLSLFLSLFLSL